MNKLNKSDMVIYNDGELELNVSVTKDTLWLTQKQLGELFNVESHNITYHIQNIYKQKELEKNPTTQKIRVVQKEGKRKVERDVDHYNLDMIISIGYRVNSITATKFRQWATSVLKSYINDGYVINSEKITHERFKELENDVVLLKSKVESISNLLEDNSLKPNKGIFFDGQTYDAYAFINDLLKSAKGEAVLIDNYIDDTVFTLFSKYQNLQIKIYTGSISKQLRLDYQKYKTQYKNIELKEFKNVHDRFLIIDETEMYHIGASLKDLGKKWFAFSKFEIEALEVLGRLK
ncbi:MAG: DNA-binding protein [Epsilonproteobacteria bacterium]|nr:DNA-binding protein [Campylobacterota bacterium]OIO13916.1 MAG: DNA-binding protein [Helicobacteraceae bacterium CG1_02_36_14]PIP10839.1 MAG: DNA-binding protein [Sulfurimonas sp. CG23_combo_of_CG06-09_8_20_14_all_36_33]PIS24464.1 MAG: DNA-binding protein [Sulfurimonas sp. CG08_land_8_20_14_0_20_36_33]PIU33705.1 MAG: DNA-binding protein [Sulfurimonas sp. CG07_land_8_20_14_0_80_36_56]PIV03495.1 MAG: DNA-binding protein [Sulfurimonas sp. CG03_land_8_20_14_0_80_36_25]PIV33914.1 MAG: DNA-bindi